MNGIDPGWLWLIGGVLLLIFVALPTFTTGYDGLVSVQSRTNHPGLYNLLNAGRDSGAQADRPLLMAENLYYLIGSASGPNHERSAMFNLGLRQNLALPRIRHMLTTHSYDLGFRAIQAKLFTDAELRDKMLQSFVDAESYYLDRIGSTAATQKSDYTLRGITASMKRRAVSEYKVAKNKQKLAEDVHAACLKYEAEHRPELEAKIDSIHREFIAEFPSASKTASDEIVSKFKPLVSKMGVSDSQVYLASMRENFDYAKDGKDREKDPFR
jgi:hypothetical protein